MVADGECAGAHSFPEVGSDLPMTSCKKKLPGETCDDKSPGIKTALTWACSDEFRMRTLSRSAVNWKSRCWYERMPTDFTTGRLSNLEKFVNIVHFHDRFQLVLTFAGRVIVHLNSVSLNMSSP